MRELTILVKTFERERALIRLLKSIELHHPDTPIIILDDSIKSSRNKVLKIFSKLNINFIETDYDIGLSRGRNILLDFTKTEYFLLCDDDFEFTSNTDIEYALKIVIDNGLDVLGGRLYNIYKINSIYSILRVLKKPINRIKELYKGKVFGYLGHLTIHENKCEVNFINDDPLVFDDNYHNFNIFNNFFIARTKKIRQINGWIPEEITLGEHLLFFIRLNQNKLELAFSKHLSANHINYVPLRYLFLRRRGIKAEKESLEYSNLDEIRVVNGDKSKFIYVKNGMRNE